MSFVNKEAFEEQYEAHNLFRDMVYEVAVQVAQARDEDIPSGDFIVSKNNLITFFWYEEDESGMVYHEFSFPKRYMYIYKEDWEEEEYAKVENSKESDQKQRLLTKLKELQEILNEGSICV